MNSQKASFVQQYPQVWKIAGQSAWPAIKKIVQQNDSCADKGDDANGEALQRRKQRHGNADRRDDVQVWIPKRKAPGEADQRGIQQNEPEPARNQKACNST